MALVVQSRGAIVVQVRHLAQKGNTFYFRRRIPYDVRKLYPSKKGDLFFSLKTSDPRQAAKRAHQEALKQDALWRAVRSNEPSTGPDLRNAAEGYLDSFDLKPGQSQAYEEAGLEPDDFYEDLIHLSGTPRDSNRFEAEHLPPHAKLALDMFNGAKVIPCLTEAVTLYCERKGEAGKKNKGARTNAVNAVLRLAGDLPIDRYTRQHAHDLIVDLRGQGLKTTTIKRYLNYISPVFTLAIAEWELVKTNVFHQVDIPGLGDDSEEREPFTQSEIQSVQADCVQRGDELAWLTALISDTGMRVSEAVGLRREDVVLDDGVPYVNVTPWKARRLKTKKHSVRRIPLVGMSLWAAKRALASGGKYLFPSYTTDHECRGTSASNAANKRLRAFGLDKTLYSFRHAMRDRLRNVGAPEEVCDKIGGWASRGVGRSYGKGHEIAVLQYWLENTVLSGIEGANVVHRQTAFNPSNEQRAV